MKFGNYAIIYSLLSVLFIFSCSEENSEEFQDLIIGKEIIINNNINQLNRRVIPRNQAVPVLPFYTKRLKSGGYAENPDLEEKFLFTLIAESLSPSYQGSTIQATHVDIFDNYAFVSFNTQGPEYLGGVQVFDVSAPEDPRIISEAILPNIDVSSLEYYDTRLYLTGAYDPTVNDTTYQTPSVIQVLSLNLDFQITGTDTILDVSSYVGTDITLGMTAAGAKIFGTTGDNGELEIYDVDSYTKEDSLEIADARSLDFYNEKAYVLKNNPGEVFIVKDGMLENQVSLISDLTPESKSELAVNEKGIFAALNAGGLQYLTLEGTNIQHIPKPEAPEGAFDENYVTNSVSVSEKLVLIGNGGAGVYVGYLNKEVSDSIVMLGKMNFKGSESVNFVYAEDNLVFVASGLGGLKILSYQLEDDYELKSCRTTQLDLAAFIPEGNNNKEARPSYFADSLTLNLVTLEETEVYISFVGGVTANNNVLGYYTYPLGEKPSSADELNLTIIFPHIDVNNRNILPKNVKYKVGDSAFPANTVIGFFAIIDGYTGPGDVSLNGNKYYTNKMFNKGDQQFILAYNPDCKDIILALEDTRVNKGDNDYNDAIFMISDNPTDTIVSTSFDVTNLPILNGE